MRPFPNWRPVVRKPETIEAKCNSELAFKTIRPQTSGRGEWAQILGEAHSYDQYE